MRSFVNLRPLKAEFSGFRYIDSCSVVQPSKERCPHGIWLITAARRSIFVVKKRVSSQHRHLFATGRVIKASKKITLLFIGIWKGVGVPDEMHVVNYCMHVDRYPYSFVLLGGY